MYRPVHTANTNAVRTRNNHLQYQYKQYNNMIIVLFVPSALLHRHNSDNTWQTEPVCGLWVNQAGAPFSAPSSGLYSIRYLRLDHVSA